MHPGPFTDKGFSVLVASFGPLLLAFLPTLLVVRPVGPAGAADAGVRAVVSGVVVLHVAEQPVSAADAAGALRVRGAGGGPAAGAQGGGVGGGEHGVHVDGGLGGGTRTAGVGAERVALGLESQPEYLTRTSPLYAIAQAVNEATPATAKIMVLGDEPRMFYLDRDFFLGNHADIFAAQELATAAGFRGALERRGVTHLLIHEATMQNVTGRRGTMETRIAELMAAHELVMRREVGPMSLWEIAPAKG